MPPKKIIRYQFRKKATGGGKEKILCQVVNIDRIKENPTYKGYDASQYYIAKIEIRDKKTHLLEEVEF
jgi:hypothetical protein